MYNFYMSSAFSDKRLNIYPEFIQVSMKLYA